VLLRGGGTREKRSCFACRAAASALRKTSRHKNVGKTAGEGHEIPAPKKVNRRVEVGEKILRKRISSNAEEVHPHPGILRES